MKPVLCYQCMQECVSLGGDRFACQNPDCIKYNEPTIYDFLTRTDIARIWGKVRRNEVDTNQPFEV